MIRRSRRAASRRRRHRALEPGLEPRFVRSLSPLHPATKMRTAGVRCCRTRTSRSDVLWRKAAAYACLITCRNCSVARTTSSGCSVPSGHRRAQIVRKRAPCRGLPGLSMRFDRKQAVLFDHVPAMCRRPPGGTPPFRARSGRTRIEHAVAQLKTTVTRHCSRPPVCKRMIYKKYALLTLNMSN